MDRPRLCSRSGNDWLRLLLAERRTGRHRKRSAAVRPRFGRRSRNPLFRFEVLPAGRGTPSAPARSGFGASRPRPSPPENPLRFFGLVAPLPALPCPVNPQVPGSSPGRGARCFEGSRREARPLFVSGGDRRTNGPQVHPSPVNSRSPGIVNHRNQLSGRFELPTDDEATGPGGGCVALCRIGHCRDLPNSIPRGAAPNPRRRSVSG